MSRADSPIANIYNPLRQDKQSLIDNFVVRQKEFNTVLRDLKSSKLNQISQNFLVQGQRGSGKTTLLARLRYEIEDSKNLSHLLAVQFAEEQYNIFSLNRLWEAIADILEDRSGFETIADEMDSLKGDDDKYFALEKYLKKNKRKLVLLIDNFGDILDKLKEKENKKLRDILHESDLQIIAASTRTLETAYKHDKPFFESFKTIYLGTLTQTDVQTLLENLGRRRDHHRAFEVIKNQRGRIEAIRRITGGIPRTIILLYEIIMDDSADVFEDLEGILDRITPLYKHKMDDLATQQQVIVDAIALNWDGMLTSEVSRQTGLATKAISAQFKILEKNGLIFSKKVNRKNKLYMLEERFFNIWYLMRYGRKKKKQEVVWLVRFLKEWCTEDELVRKAENHIALAKAGKLNRRGGYYMGLALSMSLPDLELQHEVRESTRKYLSQSDPELADGLSDTDGSVFGIAVKAHMDKDFKKAEKYYLMAIENKDTKAMNNLAVLYHLEYEDFRKAEKYYLMAVENKRVEAMFNLALLYEEEYKDFKKAEKYYLMGINHDFEHDMKYLTHVSFRNDNDIKRLLNLSEKYSTRTDSAGLFALSIVLIHAEKYKDSVESFYRFLDLTKGADNFQQHITNYLLLLISRKQRHLAVQLFQGKVYRLKEKVRPVYYALMHLMRDEYPKEYKRMGGEIKDTVYEVLEKIKALGKSG